MHINTACMHMHIASKIMQQNWYFTLCTLPNGLQQIIFKST